MGEWRDEWREVNRANWDERVPIHVSGEFYDVASFKGGQERLQQAGGGGLREAELVDQRAEGARCAGLDDAAEQGTRTFDGLAAGLRRGHELP